MAMKENTTKSMTDKTMRNMIKIDDDDKHESDEQHEDAQQHDVYNHDHSDHFLNLQSTVMNSGLDYVSALVECGSFSSWKSTSPNTGRLQTQDTVKPSLTKHRCSWLVGVRTTTTVAVLRRCSHPLQDLKLAECARPLICHRISTELSYGAARS